jgi:iron(III) transport system ATP-binding protein
MVNANIDFHLEKVPVQLKNLTKKFMDEGKIITAVDNIDITFEKGKLTTLLGPSGCGKTTTLRCIGGFYKPEEGEVLIGSENVRGVPPYKRPTGTVFQNYALFPHMSVFENIAYGLRVKKMSNKEVKDKVNKGLKLLQLDNMGDRLPTQLSGGQQQRVAIARLLVNEPKVLLLDEPLSNLDAKLRIYMREEIKNIQRELGLTTIYVTHDQEEAMTLSDQMAIMNEGRIEQIGTPIEIYNKPANKFVGDFIGEANFLEGSIERIVENTALVRIDDYTIKSEVDSNKYAEDDDVLIMIRPHDVEICSEDEADIITKVRWAAFIGAQVNYQVFMPGEDDFTVYDYHADQIKSAEQDINLKIKKSLVIEKLE